MYQSKKARASNTRKKTRIQIDKEGKILDAALTMFSLYGFRGTTVDQIAEKAGMSKPNLLYYYRRKHDIYLAVLNRTLEMWLEPLQEISAEGDPAEEIGKYIDQKMDDSLNHPESSRLFIGEILQGAPVLAPVLETRLKELVDQKAEVIQAWVDAGKLRPVDPYHLLFMIWATTQHYADFEIQVQSVLPGSRSREEVIAEACANIKSVILNGVLP